ncbi:uncharacterized protein LOC135125386 isoform X2 [Zophobas morio]|uniref:uncharacterized protein LOC135125386 isoform X2 n=1 Tax=Zophobas morio TaxID=2755281 RepID=UPI003082BD0C
MDKKTSNNARTKHPNTGRSKQVKLLNKLSTFEPLRTDFETIELELENQNLRKMITLVEGKNKVLEEHCSLLKEKNLYFETRLRDLEVERKRKSDKNESDEDGEQSEKDDEEKKATSSKDRISGVLFGVALPKIGTFFSKIREKRREIKDFIEENGPEGAGAHCPMGKADFKDKIQALKVNLFRVVIVLGSLMVLSGVGYAGYRIWKTRYRNPSYLVPSDDDEDSAEELFRAPGASRGNDTIMKTNSTDSFEAPGISTDFRSILDTANKK